MTGETFQNFRRVLEGLGNVSVVKTAIINKSGIRSIAVTCEKYSPNCLQRGYSNFFHRIRVFLNVSVLKKRIHTIYGCYSIMHVTFVGSSPHFPFGLTTCSHNVKAPKQDQINFPRLPECEQHPVSAYNLRRWRFFIWQFDSLLSRVEYNGAHLLFLVQIRIKSCRHEWTGQSEDRQRFQGRLHCTSYSV